jgi:hypothetical protein
MLSTKRTILRKQRRGFILLGTIQMVLIVKLLALLPNVFAIIPIKIMTFYKELKRRSNVSSQAVSV